LKRWEQQVTIRDATAGFSTAPGQKIQRVIISNGLQSRSRSLNFAVPKDRHYFSRSWSRSRNTTRWDFPRSSRPAPTQVPASEQQNGGKRGPLRPGTAAIFSQLPHLAAPAPLLRRARRRGLAP